METLMQSVMNGIFTTITSEKKYSPEFIDEVDSHISKINGEAFILLTVCDDTSGAYVVQGKGHTFREAVDAAIHTFYRKSKKLRFTLNSLKLDIVIDVYPLNSSKHRDGINPNETSLILYNEGFAWGNSLEILFLPEEVSTRSLIHKQQIDPNYIVRALDRHWISKGDERILDYSGLNISFPVFRIRTISFYFDASGMVQLHNGHRLFTTIDAKLLLEAITLAKDHYLKNVFDCDGRLKYSYHSPTGARDDSYNMVLHAGITYSLLEVNQLFPGNGLLPLVESSIGFLLKHISDHEIDGRRFSILKENDTIVLGGNALAIIALAKYTQLTRAQKFIPIMQQLAEWIAAQDDADMFDINKQLTTDNGEATYSDNISGETILALVRLFQIDGNRRWIEIAQKTANYLIGIRDNYSDEDLLVHDHWLLLSLNELYREAPVQAYLRHVILISKAIIKRQIRDNFGDIDWRGAYRIPYPRLESTPTACRSEGLCAAYNLLCFTGREKDAFILKTAIEEGIRFQLQNQIRPESAMYYQDKALCLGGFRKGLAQYELRVDYAQHNISSLVAYYKIITGRIPIF